MDGVFGMHSVVLPVIFSLLAYIILSVFGKSKNKEMQKSIIEKYMI
jgi:hypothetical protein